MLRAMQFIEIATKDGVAEIVLNRPKVNAMNQAFLREMRRAFDELTADEAVKGALVRGAGKCLSAGLDLREVASLDLAGLSSFMDDFDAAFSAAFRFPKPLAAAVHGHAIAGGIVLAMCADFIALDLSDYKVGLTELAVGVPLPRVALEIVRLASPTRALRKLAFGAGTHSPAEVFAMGVGDSLSTDALEDARRWLAMTCSRPAGTFRLMKATHRGEAWDRVARVPLAERQALLSALMAAKQAMVAPLASS